MQLSKKELEFQETVVRSASNTVSNIEFIRTKQQEALKRLEQVQFPSNRDEDWHYYDFKDILDVEYNIEKSSQKENQISLSKQELNQIIEKYVFKETVNNFLVTFNGAYSEEYSNFDFSNEEIKIINFNDTEDLSHDREAKTLIEKYFASGIKSEDKYFKLVNTLLLRNGFFLNIKENYHSDKPLQILHISNQNSSNQIRSLIYSGKNSQLNLLVTYVGLEDSKYFTNAVIECFLDQGSKLKLDKIQNESQEATRLYSYSAKLERDSEFEFNSFSFGAKSSRDDIEIDILGTNAKAKANGLYVLNKDRKSHHRVVINHKVPHTTSEQLFKGLLQGKSKAEFNGLIDVSKGAEKTDASQLNKNLLLSKDAHIDSRPQLNILTDDVKCSHGSTVGRLNQEELFYLESRGLNEVDAKTVLTYSFCKELIDKIDMASARNYVSNLAFANLRDGTKEDGLDTLALLAENSKFKKSRLDTNA